MHGFPFDFPRHPTGIPGNNTIPRAPDLLRGAGRLPRFCGRAGNWIWRPETFAGSARGKYFSSSPPRRIEAPSLQRFPSVGDHRRRSKTRACLGSFRCSRLAAAAAERSRRTRRGKAGGAVFQSAAGLSGGIVFDGSLRTRPKCPIAPGSPPTCRAASPRPCSMKRTSALPPAIWRESSACRQTIFPGSSAWPMACRPVVAPPAASATRRRTSRRDGRAHLPNRPPVGISRYLPLQLSSLPPEFGLSPRAWRRSLVAPGCRKRILL